MGLSVFHETSAGTVVAIATHEGHYGRDLGVFVFLASGELHKPQRVPAIQNTEDSKSVLVRRRRRKHEDLAGNHVL